MSKETVPVYVFAHYNEYLKKFCLITDGSDIMADTWVLVKETGIEVEMPAHEVLVAAAVKTLRAEKAKILAEAQVKANEVEQKIQEFLCIEYKSAPSNV